MDRIFEWKLYNIESKDGTIIPEKIAITISKMILLFFKLKSCIRDNTNIPITKAISPHEITAPYSVTTSGTFRIFAKKSQANIVKTKKDIAKNAKDDDTSDRTNDVFSCFYSPYKHLNYF